MSDLYAIVQHSRLAGHSKKEPNIQLLLATEFKSDRIPGILKGQISEPSTFPVHFRRRWWRGRQTGGVREHGRAAGAHRQHPGDHHCQN